MRWIFDIENPVMHYIVKVFDCMCLSILWLLFCLPVITAGASTTALYATVYHYIRKEEGHLWRTFWGAFRENLRSVPASADRDTGAEDAVDQSRQRGLVT